MVALQVPSLDSIGIDEAAYPASTRAQVRRALKKAADGDVQGALGEFEGALKRYSSDRTLLEGKGLLLLMLNQPSEALEYLDRAASLGEGNASLHAGRGVALYALERLNESMAAFDQSLFMRHDGSVLAMRRKALESLLWKLVDNGFASWSGGKPKGSNPPIEVTPGPPISDYVHQDRR